MDCDPTITVDVDLPSLERLCYESITNIGYGTVEEAKLRIENLRFGATEYGDYRTDVDVENYLKTSLASEVKRLLDAEMGKKGVLSLAERWDSPLMWSHYADEHRGICIEYDTTELPHPGLAAVDYRSPRGVKVSDLIKWKLKKCSEAGRRVHDTYFFAKSSQWRYEKEWRDIAEVSGVSSAEYPITAIYFGLRCDPAVVTSIVKLLSRDRGVRLYEIYPLNDSFRLKRRLVDRDEIEACGIRTSAALVFKDIVLPGGAYSSPSVDEISMPKPERPT